MVLGNVSAPDALEEEASRKDMRVSEEKIENSRRRVLKESLSFRCGASWAHGLHLIFHFYAVLSHFSPTLFVTIVHCWLSVCLEFSM